MDINLFRKDKGGDPELIKANQRRRFEDEEIVDEIVELDNELRGLFHKAAFMNRDIGVKTKEIGKIMKTIRGTQVTAEEREGFDQQILQLRVHHDALKESLKELQATIKEKKNQLDGKLREIGNLVHESVPVSKDEANNAVVVEWGDRTAVNVEHKWHHHELLYMIDGYDPERGAKVAGQRGYFLKGHGVRLNYALIMYGIDFLTKKGYTTLQTPFFMHQAMMARTAQLSQFDEELYKLDEGHAGGEKYLIATSEQPISAFHEGEWLDPQKLPLRYGGVSTCFRKEAGAYGKDCWGIFRVHQFEKIEQFCITAPDKSWEEHESMLKVSEEFYQSLGLPYRVVTIVSGELNKAAAKKYDLEGWFPGFEEYRELVSCSNCTDYQARNLDIRYGYTKGSAEGGKKYVHMLNSTLCATTRTICCILENYQTEEGIKIPAVLQPYMGGIDLIPFVQDCEASKHARTNKKKAKRQERNEKEKEEKEGKEKEEEK